MADIKDMSVNLYTRDLRFEFSYNYDFTLQKLCRNSLIQQ